MKNLEYHFIRTEADNKITLFLKIKEDILNKELDLTLTENNELMIKIEDKEENILITNVLPNILYDSLYEKETLVIFCNEDAKFLAEITLNPLQ